jgi:ABC-type Fe3+/spermidine/putrescine transport system ATPase subunit
VIEVRGLTKRYGSTVAVDRLSFDVPPGAVTGFLGLNGSGKSTTMRMILGLDSPEAGHARIGGQAYRLLRAARTPPMTDEAAADSLTSASASADTGGPGLLRPGTP